MLHAAAETLDPIIGALGEPDLAEHGVDPPAQGTAAQAVHRGPELQVLAGGEARVETALAAEDDADDPAHGGGLTDDVVPADACLPGRRKQYRGEDLAQRGLACAVRSQQAVHFAGRNDQIDAV